VDTHANWISSEVVFGLGALWRTGDTEMQTWILERLPNWCEIPEFRMNLGVCFDQIVGTGDEALLGPLRHELDRWEKHSAFLTADLAGRAPQIIACADDITRDWLVARLERGYGVNIQDTLRRSSRQINDVAFEDLRIGGRATTALSPRRSMYARGPSADLTIGS
jgi:hypothetical protein